MELRNRFVTLRQNRKTLEKAAIAAAAAAAPMDPNNKKEALFGDQNMNPFLSGDNSWLLQVPKALRQQAVFEAYTNFKTAKKVHGKKAVCKPKSIRGKDGWCISLEDRILLLGNRKVRIATARGSKIPMVVRYMQRKTRLPAWLDPEVSGEDELRPPCDAKIQMICGSYYLLLSYKQPVDPLPSTYSGHIVSLDPGIRKFQTGYGTDGHIAILGDRKLSRRFCRMRAQWYKDYMPTADCVQRKGA